jgi:hypothetical protein
MIPFTEMTLCIRGQFLLRQSKNRKNSYKMQGKVYVSIVFFSPATIYEKGRSSVDHKNVFLMVKFSTILRFSSKGPNRKYRMTQAISSIFWVSWRRVQAVNSTSSSANWSKVYRSTKMIQFFKRKDT